jgi:nucleoside-diphosphate-sugar epimerase
VAHSKPRRALVTGATGGLGLAVVEALAAAGYAVRASGRDAAASARLRGLGAEVILADLTAAGVPERLCEGIEAVFHVAALSSPWGPDEAFERINVMATRRLLEAARAAAADSFVFVSSPSIYARPRDQLGLTEDDAPAERPMNAYAATKGAAERLVLASNAAGFATVALRPRAIVGPDDKVLLPRVLRLVEAGRFPVMRGGEALIELTDVRDAAHALLLADRKRDEVGGRAFNISGGRPVRVRDLALKLAEALGRPIRLTTAPAWLVLTVAGVMQAVCKRLPGRPEPPLTPYSVAALAYSQTFDLTQARRDLGYAPRFDPVETAAAMARAGAGL